MSTLNVTAANQASTPQLALQVFTESLTREFPFLQVVRGTLGSPPDGVSHTAVISNDQANIYSTVIVSGGSESKIINMNVETIRDEGWMCAPFAAAFSKSFFGPHGTTEWRTTAYGWEGIETVNYAEMFERNLLPDTVEAFNNVRSWLLL